MSEKRTSKKKKRKDNVTVAGGPSVGNGIRSVADERAQARSGLGVELKTRHRPERWKFEAAYGDHFQTPKAAYVDIAPLLLFILARRMREDSSGHAVSTSDGFPIKLFDPYYCAGSTVKHFASLGFKHVINLNRDFYADVAAGTVSGFDVLVTNPPFSSDHKERLFQYLLDTHSQNRPFFLLMPSWVAQRSYWRQFLLALQRLRESRKTGQQQDKVRLADFEGKPASDTLETEVGVFYWRPRSNYQFDHVDGRRGQGFRAKAPFDAMWFIGIPQGPNFAKKVRGCLQGDGTAAATLSALYTGGFLLSKRDKKAKERERLRNKGNENESKKIRR